MKKTLLAFVPALACLFFINAEIWNVSTVCGANENGHQVDGGKDKACFTDHLGHCATDPLGNLFVIDESAVRKVTTDGTVQTWFGKIISDENGNSLQLPALNDPKGICIGKEGVLYISDGNTIKQIRSNKDVETYAGNKDYSGKDDGVGLQAEFDNPYGLCIDKAGNIYVADADNRSIRKIAAGTKAVTTVAGGTRDGSFKAGTGKAAQFFPFRSIAVDSKGNLYIPQNGNRGSAVAKITPAGAVSILAGDLEYLGKPNDGTGSAAHFDRLTSVAVDAQDNIIVAERYRVRKISPAGAVTTLAGGTEPQRRDAPGEKARFGMIGGLAIDASGAIYATDLYCVRKLVK